MTGWVVLVPLLGVLAVAVVVGVVLQWRRGAREELLRGDAARARQTVDYYVHVQDSMAG